MVASFRHKENIDNISFKDSLISLVPKGITNIEDLSVGYHCSVIFNGKSVLAAEQSNKSNSSCCTSSFKKKINQTKNSINNQSILVFIN